jgi:hypothetical protein
MLKDSAFTSQQFGKFKTTCVKGSGGVGNLVAGLREFAFSLQSTVNHLLNNSTAPLSPVWQRRFEDFSIKPQKTVPVIPAMALMPRRNADRSSDLQDMRL